MMISWSTQGMHKGGMALIDEARAAAIYEAMGPATESSGGSAANTIVGVASFGGRAAFIGKVKDDELGRAFAHDIRAAGVAFDTKAAKDGPSTARCYIMVTPDGERTMNTYLGAAQDLKPADIDETRRRPPPSLYLEGYLWDPPQAKEAFVKAAADRAQGGPAGRADAVGCVLRRPLSRRVSRSDQRVGTVDIVFANEHELRSLYETADFDSARAALRRTPSSRWSRAVKKAASLFRATAWKRCSAVPVDRWWTSPAPAICSRPGSWSVLPAATTNRDAARLGALAASEVIQPYRRASGGVAQGAGGGEWAGGLKVLVTDW